MRSFEIVIGLLAVVLPALTQVAPPFTDKYCRTDAYPPAEKDRIPDFVLNLDLPPEDRWTPLVKAHAKEISFLIQDIKALVGLFINEHLGEKIIDELFGPVVETFAEPYKREIQGIAKATGMPVGEIVLYNIFYEVSAFCTAIVAQDEYGDIWHARNMDFGIGLGWDTKTDTWVITERLRPLLTNVEYQRRGKTVARVVHFAGYAGLVTGIKPGVASLNVNTREVKGESFIEGLLKAIQIRRPGHWSGFALRDAIEWFDDFEDIVDHLSKVELYVPAYLILAGTKPGEGAVISRSQGNVTDNIMRLGETKDKWFLVQTNYDNWENPPFFDDRRDPAMKCMRNNTEADVGMRGIFNVLSTKPVLNVLTTFTGLMHPRGGTMDAFLRYCPEPCYPW